MFKLPKSKDDENNPLVQTGKYAAVFLLGLGASYIFSDWIKPLVNTIVNTVVNSAKNLGLALIPHANSILGGFIAGGATVAMFKKNGSSVDQKIQAAHGKNFAGAQLAVDDITKIHEGVTSAEYNTTKVRVEKTEKQVELLWDEWDNYKLQDEKKYDGLVDIIKNQTSLPPSLSHSATPKNNMMFAQKLSANDSDASVGDLKQKKAPEAKLKNQLR